MQPATRLAAISHCRGAAPVTSRRVRRSQSLGASRNISPRWPSTWMVMAPNHSTKLALCTVSSSGSHHADEHVRRQQLADAQDRDALRCQQHQQHDRGGRRQAGVGGHARIGPALRPAGHPDPVVVLRTHGAEGTKGT